MSMKLLGFRGNDKKLLVPKKKGRSLTERQSEQVKQKIKRMISIRQEKKIHQVVVTGAMPSLGSFNHVSAISQGDTDLTRDGDNLYVKSIHWSWSCVVADATNWIRLTLFQWHGDNNSNPPANADLWQTVSLEGQFSAFRKDTKSLYTIVYDRVFSLDTYNAIKSGRVNLYKGFRRNLSYLAGTSTGMNQLYTLITSDSGVTSHPALTSMVTVIFTDS